MKFTDDYKAKIRIWAKDPTIKPSPEPPILPSFPPQKFRSHAEMNDWKQSLLRLSAKLASRDE
jgi:hypothetical protein